MAREFGGSGQYLDYAAAPLTAAPLTIACWSWRSTSSGTRAMVSIGIDSVTHYFTLANSGANLVAQAGAGPGVTGIATSAINFSTGTWNHNCAVFDSSTSRSVYLNGSNKGTNASSITPSGLDRLYIGRSGISANTYPGYIAEVAIWDIALSDAEVAELYNGGAGGAGKSPALVQSANLIGYWKLLASDGNIDYAGSYNMTAYGSPPDAPSHPNIDYGSGGGSASPIPYLMQL